MLGGPNRRRAAVLALVVSAVAVLLPGPARAEVPRLRFLSFNICGGICNKGTVDRPGADNDVVEHVASTLAGFRPHVAVLNEVCAAQYERLVRLLTQVGSPMQSAFHAQRTADWRCPLHNGTRSFGDVVLSSGPVDQIEVHPLPNQPSGGEDRSLLCLRTTHFGTRLLVCGLHYVAREPDWRNRQLTATVQFLRERSKFIPVVLAGDFNAYPGELGQLTDARQGGFHTDVDWAKNAPTCARTKIDYVFLPNAPFRDLAGDVRPTRWSDHRILMGWATIEAPGAG